MTDEPNFAACCNSTDINVCDCVNKNHIHVNYRRVVDTTEPANYTNPWPDPTPEMLDDPLFAAIWEAIKSWDINVPSAYVGYCGATGNHARAIFDAVVPKLENIHNAHKALAWYGIEAEAINRNLTAKKDNGILASLTILSLDAGKRSSDAIHQLYGRNKESGTEEVSIMVEDTGNIQAEESSTD